MRMISYRGQIFRRKGMATSSGGAHVFVSEKFRRIDEVSQNLSQKAKKTAPIINK